MSIVRETCPQVYLLYIYPLILDANFPASMRRYRRPDPQSDQSRFKSETYSCGHSPKQPSVYRHSTRCVQPHRGEYLNGRTPLEALLDELNEGWVTQYMQVDGRLRCLFFASQEQVELMRCYPDMDSTYKSNRFAPLRWCQ